MHRVDLMRVFLLLVVLTMLENTTAIAAVDNTSPALQQALGLQERGVDLLNQKKYKQALEAFKKSTPILEKTVGKQHLTTATSYYLQASCCSILNEWSEALIYYHKAANIYEINKHSSADKIYNLLSVFYYKNNEYKKAIPVLKKALLSHQEKNEEYFEILKKLADCNFKESNFDYVINLIENELKNISEKNIYKSEAEVYLINMLARSYCNTGNYTKALDLFNYCLDINKNHLKFQEGTATSLNNIAYIYYILGDYKKALLYYTESLEITVRMFGSDSIITTVSLLNIANIDIENGEFQKALSVYNKILDIREKILGLDDPLVAEVLSGLASIHIELGNYENAIGFLNRAYEINIKTIGENNEKTITILTHKAVMYSKMGDFKNAILTNNEALKKLKSIFGEYHPLIFGANNNLALNYADSGNFNKSLEILNLNVENVNKFWGKDNLRSIPTYNNLAALYYESGDYLKSIDILENNLAIEKKDFGESHVKTCIVLNNLANSYLAVGDYAKSLDAFEKTLKITQAYYGDDHYKTAKIYENLACFYLETSDTDKALYYAKISYEILKQRSIDNAIEYSSILNTLAVIYNATGQKKAAFESYQQSLAIVEQKQGFFHPDTALRYHNLGCVSESLGDLKNAIGLSTNALNIRKNVFGSKHHSTAQSYNALGYLKYLNNEFDDAINLYSSALEIQSNTFGDDNLETIVTLDNIISYYYTLKKYDITMEYIDRVLIARKDLLQKVMLLGEKSRFAWQDKFRSFTYASILPPNRAADFLLWQKGIVLDSLLEDRAVALASAKTGEGAQGLQNIAQLRSKLSKIVFEQGTEKEAADLENEIGFLQRNLAQKFLHRGTQRPSLNFTMADIAPSLSAGLILLDFFYFHDPHAVKDQESERLVVIITGHDNKPTLVWIEEAADIRSSIEALRKAINQGDLERVQVFTASLSEKLWAPIAAKIPQDTNHLIISPDGELNFLSFAALFDAHGKFLAETYDIFYMGSARDLLRETKDTPNRTLRLFANPAFQRDTAHVEGMQLAMRSAEIDVFGQLQLPPLPGTEKESAEIQKIATDAGWNLQTFTREQADEHTLRQTKNPGILHLATHGFYLNSFAPAPLDSRGMSVISLEKPKLNTNGVDPMRASGIALAGAQSTLKSWSKRKVPAPETDGVLTAEEVAVLNLDGTWLVTLSACETGVGEAHSGEGVFGLRRSFMMAGAENLLMTLWPVRDESTSEIMADFYREALKTGNAPGSLAKVQREWLVKLRKEKSLLEAVRDAGPFVMATIGKPLPPLPREPAKQESLLDKVGRKIEALIQSNNTDIKNN